MGQDGGGSPRVRMPGVRSMRAGVYVRVSTERQDAANQLPALRMLCTARGWEVDVREEVESGAKARPVLDALCDDACRGKLGAIVVWALDRLGRNLWEVVARVRRLQVANVRVVSVCEPWLEQEGPARDLLLFIFSWVAEQERRRLIERTHAGLARARAKGKTLGRPRVDVRDLEQAAQMVADGSTPREAATARGIGEGTLRRYLKTRCAGCLFPLPCILPGCAGRTWRVLRLERSRWRGAAEPIVAGRRAKKGG